jgi:hypothetical protein
VTAFFSILADQTSSLPVLPADASWVGAMLIIIAGLFLAAACIGPIIRINLPDDFNADRSA